MDKLTSFFLSAALFMGFAAPAQGQTVRLWSGGKVVCEVEVSALDSVSFHGEGVGGQGVGLTALGGTFEAVDLGLPSGLKWASFNLGATKPEEAGGYYAWGETAAGEAFGWEDYKYCVGAEKALTKYCNSADYGYRGFTDTLTVLRRGDDAASAALGGGWRTPSQADFEELMEECAWAWKTVGGVSGYAVTGPSGASIFLPAVGCRVGAELEGAGSYGLYTTSTFNDGVASTARYLFMGDGSRFVASGDRCDGLVVRPVTK